ncbi:unnamed protein product, partial [Larinioides sclopetarius]
MPCRQSVWRSNPLFLLSSQVVYDLFMPFNWLILGAFFTLGVQRGDPRPEQTGKLTVA